MSVHMTDPRHHAVGYFLVLARARHLLRKAEATLDQSALANPDQMTEAARMCGTPPQWEPFDSRNVSHFERLIGALEGDVYLVGHSPRSPGLQVIRIPPGESKSAQYDIDFSFDVTLICVAAPIIGLVHHEALCAVVKCTSVQGSPEDPRELERHLVKQAERQRAEALERLPLQVRQGMLAILDTKGRTAAMKYLGAALKCPLLSAKDIVDLVDPWWPNDLATARDSNRLS